MPSKAAGPDPDVLPKPASNGTPKPDEEAAPAQGCNGVGVEPSVPPPRPEPAKEEAPRPLTPEVVSTHMVLNSPVEEVSITYPLEFERYWRAAQENPLDFTAWTELLQYVEQEVRPSELLRDASGADPLLGTRLFRKWLCLD